MKIFIGADHRGHAHKEKIKGILHSKKYDVIDCGTHNSEESCDYPKVAYRVAREVSKSQDRRGILVCMSGIGQAMAANKVPGAYAALCYNPQAATLSRAHNNANILVVGAKFVKSSQLKKIIDNFLTTPFEGGRHERRINQIKKIEKGIKLK
ncbi:MAG TPA: ribose 5-phosphate isomerase B [Candidatus Omnitrophota bacterium]|nr:ribose 5-phosphate isomerase B [Candidatus Omnitrophota bacterium]